MLLSDPSMRRTSWISEAPVHILIISAALAAASCFFTWARGHEEYFQGELEVEYSDPRVSVFDFSRIPKGPGTSGLPMVTLAYAGGVLVSFSATAAYLRARTYQPAEEGEGTDRRLDPLAGLMQLGLYEWGLGLAIVVIQWPSGDYGPYSPGWGFILNVLALAGSFVLAWRLGLLHAPWRTSTTAAR